MRNQKLIALLVMAALMLASCGGNDEPTPTPVPPPTFTPTTAPTITPAPTATPEPPTAAPTLAPTEPPPAAAPTQDVAVAQPEAPVSPLEAPVEAPVSPLPTPDASSVLTPPQPIAGLWQLVAFTDTAGMPGAIPPGGLRLQLSSTGEVGVATACERARGSYLSSPLNGVAFTIDPIGNRCAPGSNVETLITSLVSTNGYRVPPGGLVFTSNAGPLQYDFVPVIPMGDALSWPRLQSLTYFVPDAPGGNNQVALVNGEFRAKTSPDATTEFVVSLAPVHAFGEFDNDPSAAEAVVVLVVEPGDGSSSYYLVPVFNAGMFPVALQPTLLGQNLTVRNISIADGKIVVETDALGAGPGACCPQAGRRQTFTLAGDRLTTAGDEALPAATIRTRRNRLVQDVAMAPGATSLVVNGEINFNDTQPFRIRAAAGQIMTATLQTPNDDVWLSIFGENDRFVLNSINAASRTWSGPLPATQDYIINLAAVGSTTPYTLALEITGDGAAMAQMPAPAPNTRLGEIQLPGATTDKVIYLTVQNGPNAASTTAVLGALAQRCAG
ncbi:MAG: hypothetical protein IPK16_33960 [Anaerolineales bacterium]|nr:hypothetical protein [Anaerolineales bacterium]